MTLKAQKGWKPRGSIIAATKSWLGAKLHISGIIRIRRIGARRFKRRGDETKDGADTWSKVTIGHAGHRTETAQTATDGGGGLLRCGVYDRRILFDSLNFVAYKGIKRA